MERGDEQEEGDKDKRNRDRPSLQTPSRSKKGVKECSSCEMVQPLADLRSNYTSPSTLDKARLHNRSLQPRHTVRSSHCPQRGLRKTTNNPIHAAPAAAPSKAVAVMSTFRRETRRSLKRSFQ